MDESWDEQWDVVVVGSGPGGLTAAACLAGAGRRVLVVEQHDRAGMDRCLGMLRAVADEGRNRLIPGVETPTFDRWAFRPLSELFAECELSLRAQAVLDHWSGLYGGGPGQTAVAMHASIIDHYMRGAYYPEGGGQVLPARLIQVIEAHGGEVRTVAPVREITVRDRRAEGVVLDDGTVIEAPLVISNADYARTVTGLVDEHLCPPGHANFQVMTLAPAGYDYWGVEAGPADGGSYRRTPAYRARKQAVTDHLLAAAEQVLGPFRDHIVHVETATPLSQERYTHSTGGTSYGYVHSPDQSGHNRPAHRTEIDGLWVVGANTTEGHGIAGTMVGGVACAGEILERPLLVEMILGQALVDPASIPPDPPGFDPMEWSRVARLRERRAAGRAARAEAASAG